MAVLREVIDIILNTDPELLDKQYFLQLKRSYAKKYGLAEVPSNSELLRVYHDMLKNKEIEPSLIVE